MLHDDSDSSEENTFFPTFGGGCFYNGFFYNFGDVFG